MGIWEVIGSTRLHGLAARSILVSNSKPSGNKLVGIHNSMGMKFVSKFIGVLVVKSQFSKLDAKSPKITESGAVGGHIWSFGGEN
eukprot:1161690-Pelagomonas_calceolata.AAC.5